MAPLSLKIVLDNGAVTRTVLFDTRTTVREAYNIVIEKFQTLGVDHDSEEYGLFLTSADDEKSGIWLESHRTLDFYMLRDGDSLQYICKMQKMKVKMLDGSVKTVIADVSKVVGDMLSDLCTKFGITNSDEYGLCHDQVEDPEETKPATGTLTLKRKNPQREKDARLEQLSKKLKTDDNVEWLDQKRTLRELKVDPEEILLLKRRLFYSDRKIDSRDPVQLNLLYVQTRDNILTGRQVITEDKAVEFAGIQCQIDFGDFEEDKHKLGFIENLAEYLPLQYTSSWGIEKKIYREFSKHKGLSQVDAKHLYTKIAREFPTYGVTFFLVKERQKNKKKLIPRLLGINAKSILRLDENTKEILQVWRITQVQSYHAGSATFTLNFGDYSDKEYTVKTNEAFRIRDILEGYIDIIRKQREGPSNISYVEGQMICEDNVEKSKGNVIQNVVQQSVKVVEQSFVGPSKIISYEPGQQLKQGTQILTVQQMMVINKGNMKQNAMNSEAPHSHVSNDFARKLHRVNSQSVKVVMLLSDPSPINLDQVRKIADDFILDLPTIVEGVEELSKQQNKDEEDRRRLLDDLHELSKYLNSLGSVTKRSDLGAPANLKTAEEAAQKIAELSTQIMFALDPKSRKRSEFLRRSRQSFIADERMEATLRRASFLTIASSGCDTLKKSIEDLDHPYAGPIVNEDNATKLEASAVNKIGKLNAAVALLLAARADPKNMDYETAINSMTTINEYTPSLINDAKALSSTKDGKTKRELLNKLRDLCESLNNLCSVAGSNADSSIKNAANNYAKSSGKLIYLFNPKSKGKRGCGLDTEKENEILDLAKDAGGKMSLLMKKVNNLVNAAGNDRRAQVLDAAGVKGADAAKNLITCSQLVAPTIHERHCQSALAAATENMSSSVNLLSQAWKPLVEEQKYQHHGTDLDDRNADLKNALERLSKANASLSSVDNQGLSNEAAIKANKRKRLQFLKSVSDSKRSIEEMVKELNEDNIDLKSAPIKDIDGGKGKLQQIVSQKLAQLNAATATLLHATSKGDLPDYDTATLAMDTINKVAPEIVKDTISLAKYENEKTRKDMLEDVAALCKAIQDICDSTEKNDIKDLNEAAANFANPSGKLCYVFNPRTNPDKENEILDLSRSACEKASEMLSKVYQLTEAVGGEDSAKLDSSGANVVNAAQTLLLAAQITAPSITDGRCQSALITAADTVSELTQDLSYLWEPVVQNPEHQALGDQLEKDRELLEAMLEKLRNACKIDNDEMSATKLDVKPNDNEHLKFIMTTASAKKKLAEAEKLLQNSKDLGAMTDKANNLQGNKPTSEHKELQRISAQKLAELNAAIAALVQATLDPTKPDYKTAENSIISISEITPEIIKNTNKLCEYSDEKQRRIMLDNVMALCKLNKVICDSMDENEFQELSNAANKFANTSGKLYYVFNPRANSVKENQILDLSKAACEKASEMLSRVYELAEEIGGEKGSQLDKYGSRVVDSAQALLSVAQITAPSMTDSLCRSALITSADKVSDQSQELADIWEPIVQNPNHQALGANLQKDRERLESVLEKLKNVCRPENDKTYKPEIKSRESLRLKFIKTTSAAKKQLDDAEKLVINDALTIYNKLDNSSPEHKELQHRSAQKLAELNAAIAALVRATSDSANPDYIAAESAINTISQLTPEIVQNTNKLCEYADDKQRLEMLNNIRALCNANKLICDSLERNDFKELKDSANKFANSSGQLYFVFNPSANTKQQNQILDLSEEACEKTAKMLSHVYELAEKVGGEDGHKLDRSGARVADATQDLMTTAQITAPSMNDNLCRSALISSAHKVSDQSQELASIWEPIVQHPNHLALGTYLEKDRDRLESVLEKLKNVCRSENDETYKPEIKSRESLRFKFIKTTSAAKKQLDAAEQLVINDAVTVHNKLKKNSPEHKELQRRSAQKLAELNAAIAALVRATSDSANPDYVAAESAINTISQLTPEIVQNTNKLCEYADEKQRLEMLNNIRALCNANKLICDSLEKNDFKELKDSANKFANSSGHLYFLFNPTANSKQQTQILDLSEEACEKTAKMLSHVYELAEKVGGEDGHKLDRSGARVADATQDLMTTAQLTASSINNDKCQSEMIKSANTVSDLTQNLASEWEPIVQNQACGKQLNKDRDSLEEVLEKLRSSCKQNDEAKEKEQQRHMLVTMTTTAKKEMDKAEHLVLNPTDIAMRPKMNKDTPVLTELQFHSAQKLSELNATIAKLVQAASDAGDLDYNISEQAITTISKLTPEIVRNTNKLCEHADETQCEVMLDNVKELCKANKVIFDAVERNDCKGLNDAAVNYSKPSSSLCSIFNQRVHPMLENQILDLSEEACRKTSDMLTGVYELAEKMGGDIGFTLDRSGAKVADATQSLLTISQIVTPTILTDQCQSAIISSVDSISDLNENLASIWEPIVKDDKYLGAKLNKDRELMESVLQKLRNTCNDAKNREKSRLEFIITMPAAIKKLNDAEDLIQQNSDFGMGDKPTKSSMEHKELQRVSALKLAELNAAYAALVQATSDTAKVDYKAAENGIANMCQLTPEIVENTNKLCEYENEEQREVMLDNIRNLCKTNQLVCHSLENANFRELNSAAIKFGNSSAKLYYLFNRTATPMRHNQILDLTKASCEKSSEMLGHVHNLAEAVGGKDGSIIDEFTAKVVDGAQALLIVAQLTAPSIDESKCKTALITSANNLSSLTGDLSSICAPVVNDPKYTIVGDEVLKGRKEFDKTLEKLVATCSASPVLRPKPVPPVRHSSISDDDKLKATKHVHFCKSVEIVQDNIMRAKEQAKKAYNTKSQPPMIVGEQEKLQDLMEKNLALAGVTVAQLISDMSPHHINYDNAIKCTKVLAEIFPVIVKAGTELGNAKQDTDKEEFFTDMLSLCGASTKLCDTAKSDTKNLNTAAIDFGDMATRLLYKVSSEIDPAQEKEVIRRTREIGDSASRLAVRGAEGAAEVKDSRAHALCAAGARCADSASELMYTAKLVAPSIHDPESQKALLDVANQLSSKSNEFMLTWQPFSSNPEHITFVMELDAEAEQLKSLLANFKQDLKDNKMVRRRMFEDETTQDTPLRQLAYNILENAKRKAETGSSPEERRNFSNYSSKLAAAIRDLDLANARCRNSPRDLQKREELEEVVQHLQQICLESRIQSASGEQKRFVDLMDLINDVSSDAKQLSDETYNVKAVHNKDSIIIIKDEADDIVKEAVEVAKPNVSDDGGVMDDIMIIKQFAQKCDDRVNALLKVIEEIHEEPYKTTLRDKLVNLKGSTDMLRFAVNSHIAAVSSATLDMNMADFEELEKNIDNVLQSTRKKNINNEKESSSVSMATATTLCSAVAYQNAAEKIPPALAAYLLETRSRIDLADPKQKYRLEEHLKNLLRLLKTQTMASSRRIATWQEEDDGEISEITHQIIQEIENFNRADTDEAQKSTDLHVVNESDLKKLLLPTKGAVMRGNQKELYHKLEQHMQKLGSMASMVQLGIGKREALARTLHTVADVALQLALIARSVAADDRIKKMKIEEATQTMCSTTYNLLKTAEVASQDPQNPDTHRRLHEACRLLNESITKLSRVTLPEDRMKRDCSEIARNLQLQLGLLQTDYPTCSMTYEACLKPLENQNNLQSLQIEEPMSREECSAHLQYLSSMVCHSAEYAAQCGYLLSLPQEYEYIAKEGFLNVPRIRNITGEIRVACLKIIRSKCVEDANYSQSDINKHIIELQEVTQEAAAKIRDPEGKKEILEGLQEMESVSKDLREALRRSPGEMNAIIPLASRLLDATEDFNSVTTHLNIPSQTKPSIEKKARSEEVINYAKTLITKTQALVKQVGSSDHEVLTWKMFTTGKQGVTNAYEDFVSSIRENGRRAGFIEVAEKKEEAPKKTFIEIQLDLANKWLTKPAAKPDAKAAGIQGVRNIIELAENLSEDMKGEEKVDMQGMVDESKDLLEQCVVKYNSEKASLLLERLKELHKMLTWRVVTRVVEDFLEDEPLADLDIIADSETDEKKRKYILDKKIAELLGQLGRVKKTARFVADAGSVVPSADLIPAKDQVELLAPALVKAAQKRIETPNNMEAINNYKILLAQYSESMSRIREICDRSVDPMDFAQAAGDTIQRMREESTTKNDPQACSYTSRAITRLGLRVIEAGLCSQEAKNDPELKQALAQAQSRLTSTTQRSSRVPDWRDITAEILRTTGQVESFLGGENIFQKQPEPDQPIYAAALDLHATVREWSARDNEIVAVAKRMAVQMARLSEYMNTDRKSELLATSKKIVAGSHQVAALARKLALECTDMRIRTNLLQVCDRIPTISGQLKMLITVKGSSLGQQGSEEDKEAMTTLITNAQNLMSSIQEVVKAAIGASVKIMSQRGPRMKWVRRNYY